MASTKEFSPFVPFDLYDFFGYLFPGILFAANAIVFLKEIYPNYFDEYFKIFFLAESSSSLTFIGSTSFIVVAIVLLYTIGHFIATLSHIIIDRVLIDGVEGYPLNFLLDIPRGSRPYSEATFKYLFALFNLLFLIPFIFSDYGTTKSIIILILILVVILILFRFIIMLIRAYKSKETAAKIANVRIFKLFYLPSKILIDPIIEFYRRLLGMDRKFPESFIRSYKELYKERFPQLEPDDVGSENYWLSVFHVNNSSIAHQRVLYTWLHLYGFSRNTCAAFYLSGVLIIVYILFHESAFTTVSRYHIFILWIFSVMLGLRYWILYSHYYSKAVIRAFYETVTSRKIPDRFNPLKQ